MMFSAMPAVMMKMQPMMHFGLSLRGRLVVGVEGGKMDLLDGHDLLFVCIDRRESVRLADRTGEHGVVGVGLDRRWRRPMGMRWQTPSQSEQAAYSQRANRQETDGRPHVLRPRRPNVLRNKRILGKRRRQRLDTTTLRVGVRRLRSVPGEAIHSSIAALRLFGLPRRAVAFPDAPGSRKARFALAMSRCCSEPGGRCRFDPD
jgi:hypothetical protein